MNTSNFKPGDNVSCYLGIGIVESVEKKNPEKIHVVLNGKFFLRISAQKLKLIVT